MSNLYASRSVQFKPKLAVNESGVILKVGFSLLFMFTRGVEMGETS